jgi:adenylate cyclase
MAEELTELELARRLGEPADRVREWQSLGLIGPESGQAYRPEDVQRGRLVQLMLRRGVDIATIVRAEREENLLSRRMEQIYPGGVGRTHSVSEAADLLGLQPELLRRLVDITGLDDENDLLFEADLQALQRLKLVLDGGVPAEAVLQLARVYADALGRVADAETRLFHFYVHDRLKSLGLSGRELADTVQASTAQLTPLIQPLLLYFHRKGWDKAIREDAVFHAREYAGFGEKTAVPGQIRVAIAFVDLCGFTSLADAMGDEPASRVLERFSQIVRDDVGRTDGRVVKQIGDAFMLVFPEAHSAVACALEIERRTAAEPQFPGVRSGIHCGPVLYREGDYLGTNVNIAARVAAEAGRHQLLVTAAARNEVVALPDAEFVPHGKRRLRGLAEDLELFAVVTPSRSEPRRRLIDPVCGMELDADDAAATLSFFGQEQIFCSQECLQRFVAAPDRYLTTDPRA